MTEFILGGRSTIETERAKQNDASLKDVLLGTVDSMLANIIPRFSSRFATLTEVFPNWNILPLTEVSSIVSQAGQLAGRYGLYDDSPVVGKHEIAQLIPHTLQRKKHHLVGAIGSTGQGSLDSYRQRARAVGMIELLLVDFPDTFGDYGGLRDPGDSTILYSFAESALTQRTLPPQKVSDETKQPLLPFLSEYRDQVEKSVSKIFSGLYSRTAERAARQASGTIAHDYGECVRIMHVQEETLRKEFAEQYLRDSLGQRDIPEWLREPTLWYAAQGSPLGVFGILNEAALERNMRAEEVGILADYYEQVIPLIHVLLDDTQDRQEDVRNGDPNLFQAIMNGSYDKQIKLMEEVYGEDNAFSDYPNNPESRVRYFFKLLGKAYKQKEIHFINIFDRKRADKHIKLFKDMVHFYKLQLEQDGLSLGDIEYDSVTSLISQLN